MHVFKQVIFFHFIAIHSSLCETLFEDLLGDISDFRRRIVGGTDDIKDTIAGNCPLNDRLPGGLSNPLQCARTCKQHERPRICYYRFVLEIYSSLGTACELCSANVTNRFCNNCACVPVDGVERPVLVVNRMIPGPSIEVCKDDRVVIDIENQMEGEGVTIHWHGIYQKGSQFFDGVPHITQCPIPEQTTFRYQWNAANSGTHFWHAHTGLQKMDGIFGSIIVREPHNMDPNNWLYDYDLSRHVIVINDWMHELASSRTPGRIRGDLFQYPDSLLINGKGKYVDLDAGTSTNTDIKTFTVRHKSRYRFRMVNAFCTVCPGIVTVEGHTLTVIATDGVSILPVVVNSIVSFSGERYDFIINTKKTVGTYWIQLRALHGCAPKRIQQLAILRYEGGPSEPFTPAPTFEKSLPTGVILNPVDGICNTPRTDAICISQLRAAAQVDKGIRGHADISLHLPFQFFAFTPEELFVPNTFRRYLVAPARTLSSSMVDGISFIFPPSPLLTQDDDIEADVFCNGTARPANCTLDCACTHLINLPYNGIVEMILVDAGNRPNLSHPFHLHGYAFHVIGMGSFPGPEPLTLKDVIELDRKGLIPRNYYRAPGKDTITVPTNGYVIIRFRADNPGYWLFHCHFIYHLVSGMALVFHVGERSNLPAIPADFPKCGNFLPHIGVHTVRE